MQERAVSVCFGYYTVSVVRKLVTVIVLFTGKVPSYVNLPQAPSVKRVGNYNTLALPTGKSSTTQPSRRICRTTSSLLPSTRSKLKRHRKPQQESNNIINSAYLVFTGTHQTCIEVFFLLLFYLEQIVNDFTGNFLVLRAVFDRLQADYEHCCGKCCDATYSLTYLYRRLRQTCCFHRHGFILPTFLNQSTV